MRIKYKKFTFCLFILIVLASSAGCNIKDRLRKQYEEFRDKNPALKPPPVVPGPAVDGPDTPGEGNDTPGETPEEPDQGGTVDEPFPEDPPPLVQEWPDTDARTYAISAVYPDIVPLQGGRRVIVRGDLFSNKSQVFIGGKHTIASFENGRLIAYVPPHKTPGLVDVEVVDPLRGSTKLQNALRYYQPISIERVRPNKIPAQGGGKLFIEGKGFRPDTSVMIGENEALTTTYIDDTHLVVTPPPYSGSELSPKFPSVSTSITLTSKYESVRFADRLSYVAPVRLTRVEPVEVDVTGGSRVTLRGSGFVPDMQVKLGPYPDSPTVALDSYSADGTFAIFTTPVHSAGYVDLFLETSVDSTHLSDGLYFYDSSVTPAELGPLSVSPASGSSAGGTRLHLTGAGIGFQDDEIVEVGGSIATLLAHGPGWIDVETPVSPLGDNTPGKVDIKVTIPAREGGSDRTVVAAAAFSYQTDMSIVSLSPSEGSYQGGEELTLRGNHLDGVTNILLGGVPLPFRVVDDSTIELTTVPHRVGFADIVVEKGDYEIAKPDFFRFTSEFAFYAVRPTEGSVVGGTLVEILGDGFNKTTSVKFGDLTAEVKYVSNRKLYVSAPKHAEGSVDITVIDASGKKKLISDAFLYEQRSGTTAGASGGAIEGSINVSVYSSSGRAIKDALVLLSTRNDSPYRGVTDESGSVTISGDAVFGEQTLSVTAYGYGASTVQRVNARNVTVILDLRTGYYEMPDGSVLPADEILNFDEMPNLPHGGGNGGGGDGDGGDGRVVLSEPVIRGHLYGLDKIGYPNENQSIRGYVFTTQIAPNGGNPPTGPGGILTKSGAYEIKTRVGDLAVIALGGIYDHATGSFTPLAMGVKRFISMSLGQTLDTDLTLDIPLNTTMRVKFAHVPSTLPNKRLTHWIHLGVDGYFKTVDPIFSTDSIVELPHQPNITRDLPGATYYLEGRAFSYRPHVLPISVSYLENVTEQSSLIQLPGLFPIVNVTNEDELRFGRGGGKIVHFTLDDPNTEPDFFFIKITDGNETLWRVLLPGASRSFQLPDFPDFSAVAGSLRAADAAQTHLPEPYPPGNFIMRIFAVKQINFNFNLLNYARLLSGSNLLGYSYTIVPISFSAI